MEPKKLHPGDPCPACGGELQAAIVPTDEQYRKALDRENPESLQPGADTASPDVRADLGALHRCARCGYQARFKDAAAAGGTGETGEPAAAGGGASSGAKTARGSR